MFKIKEFEKRDFSIDILRWLAITGIILVHIQPSIFWAQLRSFDVPMMVFLSAYCFANGSHGLKDYKSYFLKDSNLKIIFSFVLYANDNRSDM